MTVSNEQAMDELLRLKRKPESASELLRAYDAGYLRGLASAFWRTDVISYQQYMLITNPDEVPA